MAILQPELKPITLKLNDFDPARYLEDNKAICDYLETILEEDAGLLAAALGDIAKVRGMSDISRDSGISRGTLYKALRADLQPRFDTISRVLSALGLKITIQSAHR
jgi:probable addiction module antidote protein